MIIAVEGTKSFSNYETFMRAMGVALSTPNKTDTIEVWSAGPHKINSFTAAFCNSSENFLRSQGYRVTFKKLPASAIEQQISEVDYLAYFSGRKESLSRLIGTAQLAGTEVGIFRV